MAQATILATGTSAATSTDVVVAAGASASVGLFTADAGGIPATHSAVVMMDTPSGDQVVCELTGANPVQVLTAPGTYRVSRRLATTSFGVYTET